MARLKEGNGFRRLTVESPSIRAETAQDGVKCLLNSKLPIQTPDSLSLSKQIQGLGSGFGSQVLTLKAMPVS